MAVKKNTKAAENKRDRLEEITLPKGTFQWPALVEPVLDFSKKNLEYRVDVILDGPGAETIAALLDERAEAAYTEAVANAKDPDEAEEIRLQRPYKRLFDDNKKPTGQILVKVKEPAVIKYKDRNTGEEKSFEKVPDIFDGGNPPKQIKRTKALKIYAGTVGRVRVALNPYYIPGSKSAGVSLKLIAVQVLKLVSAPTRDAASLGFEGDGEAYEEPAYETPEGFSPGEADGDDSGDESKDNIQY